MIVLTGPGRSGTSLLALLYRELGFDPGGRWRNEVNAGLENRRCVELNQAVLAELGTNPNGARGDVPPTMRASLRPFLPRGLRRRLRRVVQDRSRQQTIPPVRWSRMPETVNRLGPELRAFAQETAVVKDPRFCFTLGVWLASGAAIDHVVVTLRDSGASAASRVASELSKFADADTMRTSTVLGLGALFDVLLNAEVPYQVLRFPAWANEVDDVAALPFPRPVPLDDIQAALGRVFDPDLVHHG